MIIVSLLIQIEWLEQEDGEAFDRIKFRIRHKKNIIGTYNTATIMAVMSLERLNIDSMLSSYLSIIVTDINHVGCPITYCIRDDKADLTP